MAHLTLHLSNFCLPFLQLDIFSFSLGLLLSFHLFIEETAVDASKSISLCFFISYNLLLILGMHIHSLRSSELYLFDIFLVLLKESLLRGIICSSLPVGAKDFMEILDQLQVGD